MKRNMLLIGIIFSFISFSCQNDDNDNSSIQLSPDFIEMEAEGGEEEISFSTEDWKIGSVINQDEKADIYGDTYGIDWDLIHTDEALALEGEGRLLANWRDKGFTITKDSPTSLAVALKENNSGENFDFTILISSLLGEQQKEIRVSQKPSQGYDFSKIEFSLKTEDGDSLFMKEGTRREFNLQTAQTIEFSPFGGKDILNRSHFESSQEDAFVGIEKDSLLIEVPFSIANGKMSFNGETQVYNEEWNTQLYENEEMATITLPAGQSLLYTEIEYRKRTVSYTLHLTNRRTGKDKTITGKWIEITPTGEYSAEKGD